MSRRVYRELEHIESLAPMLASWSTEELVTAFAALREQRAALNHPEQRPTAFAIVRELAGRVLGQRPYPVQVLAGLCIAEGCIAELATGEGKTLSATMPAAWFATSQEPVHVATANDYLASRDATWMGKLYSVLGFRTAAVVQGMSAEDTRQAYDTDIVYSTAQQLGFDFLHDRMAIKFADQVQRGHFAAIVDEADALLIDEARTALIISGPDSQAIRLRWSAGIAWARTLEEEEDYLVDLEKKESALGPRGVAKAEEFFGVSPIADHPQLVRMTHHCVEAIALYERDRDYIVTEEEENGVISRHVVLVDTNTGRAMPDRRFQDGLHEALEAKEGIEPKPPTLTYTSISVPSYFNRYYLVGGMTGTAASDAAELMRTYGTPVARIPTHRPRIRIDHPDRLYVTSEAKIQALIREIRERTAKGQPVLVGAPSVREAQAVAEALTDHGITHTLLTARHHREEAAIIAQAGRPGAVTVATNMAGRGVDITLGGDPSGLMAEDPEERSEEFWADVCRRDRQKVLNAGGLCVIGTGRHEARRVDNQLRGRAGRQGEPGESLFLLSCEDELIQTFGGSAIGSLLGRLGIGTTNDPLTHPALNRLVDRSQRKVEEHFAEVRDELLRFDRVIHAERDAYWSWRDSLVALEFDELGELALRRSFTNALKKLASGDSLRAVTSEERSAALGPLWPYPLPAAPAEEESLPSTVRVLVHTGMEELRRRHETVSSEAANAGLHMIVLQNLDMAWALHLRDLEHLQTAIELRAHAQQDPATAYALESHELLQDHLSEGFDRATRTFWRLELIPEEERDRRAEQAVQQETSQMPAPELPTE